MIKFILYLILFTCAAFYSQAQLALQWNYRYGGVNQEWLFDFKQTVDSGYVLGGASTSSVSGDKTQVSRGNWDYWIIKLDGSGIKQWDKRFGGTGEDDLYSLNQTRDGGYILGGSSYSQAGGDKTQPNWDTGGGTCDYWIVKTDDLGNYQWDKRFGTPDWDYFSTVVQTKDGGYLIGGSTYGDSVGDKTQHNWNLSLSFTDYWIVKTDSMGTRQWDKRFGGTGSDALTSLQQTADGGYILGGHSVSGISGDKTDTSRGGEDFWIVKIDSAGTVHWDKTYGGTGADYLQSLQQTTDHGYILGGYSTSGISGDKTQINYGGFWGFDFWVVKIDSMGNKQWDKDFGGTGDEDGFGNVTQTLDDGYLVAGSSYSNISGTKSEANSLGSEQMWVTKTDTAGIKQWDKTMFTNDHDEIGYAIQTKEGCYAMANYTSAGIGGYKTQPNWDASRQSCDFWIIKFCDSTQCFPVAAFSSSDSAFCSEPVNCINFFDNSTCNPTAWRWTFTGAVPDTSTQQNPTGICYYNAGTYPVTLIVTNGIATDTLVVSSMITVSNGPNAPNITVLGGDTLVSSHASNYQWFYNGNSIAGATDSSYIALQGGTYAVFVSDDIGCGRLSGGVLITSAASALDFFNGAGEMTVYPNPAGNELWITSDKLSVKEATIELSDIFGQTAYRQFITSNSKPITVIDVSAFAKGVYIIQLTIGNDTYRKRVVID